MSEKPKILAFAGSTREESFNKKMVKVASAGAREAGADVTVIDLRDYPMPLYDADVHEADGHPVGSLDLKEMMFGQDGFLIASPEYNGSFSGMLKNAIDWVSRPTAGEKPLSCFRDKVAVIMSTSPGALGGLRGLVPLRMLLNNLHVVVLPDQLAIPDAGKMFDSEGKITEAGMDVAVRNLGATLTEYLLARGQ